MKIESADACRDKFPNGALLRRNMSIGCLTTSAGVMANSLNSRLHATMWSAVCATTPQSLTRPMIYISAR